MRSYQDALAQTIEQATRHNLATEEAALADLPGRVCAESIVAPRSIQPFDNAAMDGFAVRREDLMQATTDHPVTLRIAGVIAAGDAVPDSPLQQNQCLRIMTGAPMPPAADAVVPIERVTVQQDGVIFTDPPAEKSHIRLAGEDFRKGQEILCAGTPLTQAHILPLATLGIDRLPVYRKPKAVFISTGRELLDDLSADLQSGQIYNSNRPYALAMLAALGVETLAAHTIADDPAQFEHVLTETRSQNPDFIISSGAVSAGDFDFVRSSLEKQCAEILFHGLKLKPGKPNLLARLPNGTLYFGLPGNPVATAVGVRFLVAPALRAMTGQPMERPIHARAMTRFSKKQGLHMFLKARMTSREDGQMMVEFLEGQASFMASPFLQMNGWASLPEDKAEIRPGDRVAIYPLLP